MTKITTKKKYLVKRIDYEGMTNHQVIEIKLPRHIKRITGITVTYSILDFNG